MDDKEQGLYEAYTDEQGFSWDENGDIVAIPEAIKDIMDAQFEFARKMVEEGKIDVKK